MLGEADGAGADEFCLLGPHPAGARENPRRTYTAVIVFPAHDGGIPVTGKRNSEVDPVCETAGAAS